MRSHLVAVGTRVLNALTGEFMLSRSRRPNSGGVVLVRALYCSALVYAVALGLREGTDPQSLASFSWRSTVTAIHETIPWMGAIFAAIYVTLYARFSSQWLYLSDLYNQIKRAQLDCAQAPPDDWKAADAVLSQWKAGFIADAVTLHLATKRLYAGLVREWLTDDNVSGAIQFVGTERADLDEALSKMSK